MDDKYPSNSNNAQPKPVVASKAKPKVEKPKIEQITTGPVIRRKPSMGKRFGEMFGAGDAQSVGAYIVTEVMLPAAKDMVADAVSQGIEKMLFGEARAPRARATGNRAVGGATSHVSYNRFAVNPGHRPDPRAAMSPRAKATHNFDEIILPTRAEADEVMDMLFTLINEYDAASVANLYEMVGQTPEFTDEKWGWTDLRGTSITRVKGGYLLDLPRPETLD